MYIYSDSEEPVYLITNGPLEPWLAIALIVVLPLTFVAFLSICTIFIYCIIKKKRERKKMKVQYSRRYVKD